MALHKYSWQGYDYEIETVPHPKKPGKWIVVIFPVVGGGSTVRQPHATLNPKPPAEFDSETEAVDAAEVNIRLNMP